MYFSKSVIIVFLLINLSFSYTHGQDTLVLLNGKHKTNVMFLEMQDNVLMYQLSKNQKIKLIPHDQVYAVFSPESKNIITFLTDSAGDKVSEKCMFDYLEGMHDARENFNNITTPLGGFVVSAGAGIWPGVPLGLLVPVLYPGVVAMNEPKTKNLCELPEEKKEDVYYIAGYKEVAKQKKVRSSVIGAGTGFLVGMLLNLYLIYPR